MPNLEFGTPELDQLVTCGSTFDLAFHAHEIGGNNFNWTGYTPKGKLTVGSVSITVSGTVISASGGTATLSWTSAQTATLPDNAWGSVQIWADSDSSTTNIGIGTVNIRTVYGAIP